MEMRERERERGERRKRRRKKTNKTTENHLYKGLDMLCKKFDKSNHIDTKYHMSHK